MISGLPQRWYTSFDHAGQAPPLTTATLRHRRHLTSGTISGMTTTKLTITVPEELGAYIREQVTAGKFESISAFVTRAAESMRDFEPLDLLIASMIAETGEPDPQAAAWVERAIAAAARAKSREKVRRDGTAA